MDPLLDLIRYMRDDLHRRAQVITAPLLCDDRVVDLAGCHVRRARDVPVDEALVVAEVQVALGAVFGDEDLTMLIGRHRPGIDVEVGIHLERRDSESSRGEDATEGSGGDAFAQRGSDPSGHEHKLRHGLDLRGFFNDTEVAVFSPGWSENSPEPQQTAAAKLRGLRPRSRSAGTLAPY